MRLNNNVKHTFNANRSTSGGFYETFNKPKISPKNGGTKPGCETYRD